MYRALEVSTDGDAWIFDHKSTTPKEVWGKIWNQGSKWYFFPIPFVIRGEEGNTNFKYRKIIEACDGLEFLKGKTIRTALQFIKDNPDHIQAILS